MPTIALLGGECSGKTSLAHVLADALHGIVVPEELRAFVQQHGRAPHQTEQAQIFATQLAAIRRAQSVNPDRWIVCDPAAAMTAIYSQIYFADDTLLADAMRELVSTDAVIWCDIDLPWEPDGLQRDGVHMRQAAHDAIAVMVNVMPDLKIHPVSGSVRARAATVLDSLGGV